MKREFLKELGVEGLTDEAIDKIMAENGKDVEAQKARAADLKTQLDDVQAKLKAFDGVNVEELQGKIKSLTEDIGKKETEYQGRITKMERQRDTDAFLMGWGRNSSTRRPASSTRTSWTPRWTTPRQRARTGRNCSTS